MTGSSDDIRVLHVDDDADFADLAARFLERKRDRFDVATETDAGRALERLSEEAFDCVVSDYEMPGMGGIDFLKALREHHPDLPFVLYTGEGSETVASEAIRNGATDYLQKETGTDQYELLANRIENAVEQYRASRRAADLDRVRGLINDVNQALVRADDREEVEQAVCAAISESEPYLFAWIGEVDDDRVRPREWAGEGADYLDEITISLEDDPIGNGPTARAVRTRELVAMQDIPESPEYEPWREQALDRGYRSSAAVPLVQDGTLYGVLNVYADRTGAFDELERELLAELGDDVAHALESIAMQRRLRTERDRQAALFENTPDPALDVSFEGGDPVIEDVNDAFEEAFGFAEQSVQGRTIGDVLVPDSKADQHESIRREVLAGRTVEREVERRTADGTREFLIRVIPIEPSDGPGGAFAWYTDVTERKERERRLRRQNEKIEALHRVATDIETRETADGVYELIVDAAESILSFDIAIADAVEGDYLVPRAMSSDLSTEQYYEETPVDADDNLAARVYRTGETSNVADLRAHGVAPADPEFRSALTVPIGDHGVFQTVAETTDAFDETDRELAELLVAHARARLTQIDRERELRDRTDELRHQNERLDEFASIVSHDLRNPVGVAEGHLELARENCDDEHLAEVARSLDRMRRLIEDVLALAREGTQARELQPVDLAKMVDRCWRNVDAEGATLSADLGGTVRADPAGLRQLFENLLGNAVEHSSASPRSQTRGDDDHAAAADEVTVTVGELDDGFFVADDGPGIPEDERDRVFESGYTTAQQGTGFGLAIVRETARAHGWSVEVTESDAGGARFEVRGVEFVEA